MGGKHLRETADEFLFDLASLGLTGFIDPLSQFLLIQRLLRVLRRHLDRRPPALVVTIDFYGFNHQVLGLAKHRGVPAYYYISPQVWASRAYRVQKLKRLVERMLLIFPFEEKIYASAGVPCTFVGHPLIDLLPEAREAERRDGRALRIGLLPGSRPAVVNKHLPIYLEALALVRKEFPRTEAYLFASSSISDEILAPHLERAQGAGQVCIVRESDYSERSRLDFAMTTSGTATLENALLGIPMVVAYKTNWPTYLIAKAIALVKHVAMANILTGRELIPELLQSKCTAETVAGRTLAVLKDPGLDRLRADLAGLRAVLGGGGAAKRAAGILADAVRLPQSPRIPQKDPVS
jgi:lipid-A-disaccharide synthase